MNRTQVGFRSASPNDQADFDLSDRCKTILDDLIVFLELFNFLWREDCHVSNFALLNFPKQFRGGRIEDCDPMTRRLFKSRHPIIQCRHHCMWGQKPWLDGLLTACNRTIGYRHHDNPTVEDS